MVSPDAVLIRFLSDGGTDPWTIVFWKMLLSIPLTATFAIYEARGVPKLWQSIVEGRRYYAVAVPVQACINICFTMSFAYNSAAHALLLINLNPLWCAVLGRFVLGDELPRPTKVALVAALGSMLVIFVPEIVVGGEDDDDTPASTLKGNLISFFTGILLAIYITIVRKGAKSSSKNTKLTAATSFAAIVSAGVSCAVRRGDVLPNEYYTSGELWRFWLPMVAEGLMIGTVYVALAVAPRLATGADVALVLLLEVFLGPMWVFLAYKEAPANWTLVGGALLLLVLALHELSRPLLPNSDHQCNDPASQCLKTELFEVTSSGRSEQQVVQVPFAAGEDEKREADSEVGGCVHSKSIVTGDTGSA